MSSLWGNIVFLFLQSFFTAPFLLDKNRIPCLIMKIKHANRLIICLIYDIIVA